VVRASKPFQQYLAHTRIGKDIKHKGVIQEFNFSLMMTIKKKQRISETVYTSKTFNVLLFSQIRISIALLKIKKGV